MLPIFGNQNGAVAMLSSFKAATDLFGLAQELLHQSFRAWSATLSRVTLFESLSF
jgi:hypothetical protein